MKTACGTAEYVKILYFRFKPEMMNYIVELRYVAPEVLLRTPYTVSVDMWAVGVITYILISGQMPFDDQNKMLLYKKILNADYSLEGEAWQNASKNSKDFISKLLVLEPKK